MPLSGCSSPVIILNSVVLPAPFGPMTPTMPPRRQVEVQAVDQQRVAEPLAQVPASTTTSPRRGPGAM